MPGTAGITLGGVVRYPHQGLERQKELVAWTRPHVRRGSPSVSSRPAGSAAVLGAALARTGHVVVGASAVSQASRKRADELLPGVPLADPTEVAARADLVLLAVPDDELAGLVRGLVATDSLRAGQIVVHTSGAQGVRGPRTRRRTRCAAARAAPRHDVHRPLGGPATGWPPRASASRRRTATRSAWSVGEALVVEMDAEPVRVPEAVRPLYHAALAHGANHLITLVRDAADLLTRRRRRERRAPARPAAVRRARQRAAPRRPRTHRSGRPRRHGYRAQAPRRARRAGARDPAQLPRARPRAPPTGRRTSGLLKPDAANDVRTHSRGLT